MPYRKLIFTNNEIYHIFNRGVAQMPIFLRERQYQRFLDLVNFYRYSSPRLSFSHYVRLPMQEREELNKRLKENERLVEIIAYCLMPNHFHLLLRQLKDKGISTVLSNVQNGYVRYFNLKHKRKGPLFESMFKAVRTENDEQFLHVSRYIHLNPTTSYLVEAEQLSSYTWSSLPEYLGERESIFVNKELIIGLIRTQKKYKNFVFDQVKYQQELYKIKHLSLENP